MIAFFNIASTNVAFVSKVSSVANSRVHSAGCACPSCVTFHTSGCSCAGCASTHRTTALFADVADDVEVPAHVADDVDVPAEVEAMDGVESADEAHNVERPARANLKKKKKEGKEITELEVGSMVTGSVKSITTYGAFIDIGAQTDGLLHISQLASGFVANVGDILKEGQEVEVRIVSVDTGKGQVALSLLTEEEAAAGHQPRRERPKRQSNRRDDSAALSALAEKGFDPETFVEGKVVSTVDFGCFVRVDVSKLNGECEGEIDGLVHISALGSGRVNSVTDVVNVDDSVQVRLKSINGNKVSLTMLSLEDEAKKMEAQNERRGGGEIEGAKDWKEQLEKLEDTMPTFKNPPLVEDRRK